MRIQIQLRITAADDSVISADLPYFDMLPMAACQSAILPAHDEACP